MSEGRVAWPFWSRHKMAIVIGGAALAAIMIPFSLNSTCSNSDAPGDQIAYRITESSKDRIAEGPSEKTVPITNFSFDPSINSTVGTITRTETGYYTRPNEEQWIKRFACNVNGADYVLAWFTIFLAISTFYLWRVTERLAQGADKQAELTHQALISVERPILLINMMSGVTNPEIFDGVPKYLFAIENHGKQIAYILMISGDIFVQDDSDIPTLSIGSLPDEPNDSFCSFVLVGEPPLVRGDPPFEIWAQRKRRITAEQIAEISRGRKYCFARVSVVYRDPIGTVRNMIAIFALVPTGLKRELWQIQHRDFIIKSMESGGFAVHSALARTMLEIAVRTAAIQRDGQGQEPQ